MFMSDGGHKRVRKHFQNVDLCIKTYMHTYLSIYTIFIYMYMLYIYIYIYILCMFTPDGNVHVFIYHLVTLICLLMVAFHHHVDEILNHKQKATKNFFIGNCDVSFYIRYSLIIHQLVHINLLHVPFLKRCLF